MATTPDRTIWFPRDFPLFVVLSIPLWGMGGIAWGLLMAFIIGTPGSWILFLFLGLLWGASVWFFFSIVMAITHREKTITIPLQETNLLSDRLDEAVKRARYTIEQQSQTSFVCKPKHFIARLFDFQRLHVSIWDNGVELIGPALIVNKVRKQLLASSPRQAKSAASKR